MTTDTVQTRALAIFAAVEDLGYQLVDVSRPGDTTATTKVVETFSGKTADINSMLLDDIVSRQV